MLQSLSNSHPNYLYFQYIETYQKSRHDNICIVHYGSTEIFIHNSTFTSFFEILERHLLLIFLRLRFPAIKKQKILTFHFYIRLNFYLLYIKKS